MVVTVLISDKYHPDYGHQPLILSGNSTEFRETLRNFESGQADMRHTARRLISLLFKRDFTDTGKHWDKNGPSITFIKKHDSGAESYACEETADWDWKDINAQAKSSAVITLSFDRLRIRIDNYSYYCAG